MLHVTEYAHEKGPKARVQIIHEATNHPVGEWQLCLQWCRYIFANEQTEIGYRFIWRRPDGSLQAARGQARIPSFKHARALMQKAEEAGWGNQAG